MQLSVSAISNFKRVYEQRFGVMLSDEEANEKGLDLLRFMKLIYKPIPKTQQLEYIHKSPGE